MKIRMSLSSVPRHRTTPHRAGVVLSALVLMASALAAGASPASAMPTAAKAASPAGPGKSGKIAPGLRRRFEQSASQPQDFWVMFGDRADTSGAQQINDWAERGRYVVDRLQQAAHKAQAGTIARLKAAGVRYKAYWVIDAIRVYGGSYSLALALSGEPDVGGLIAPVKYEKPNPVKEQPTSSKLGPDAAASVEWGLANIQADQVWQKYSVRGDGITVASIDTGVQFDHPALVDSYRGTNADGTFDNDYNWFDVSGQSKFPVDKNGHGTHTMGTMVGDDHAANQVGVAPGAKWIEANGCSTCADDDLIASAQWMLAPTRVDGSDPDPAKRPNIINNSWGSLQPSTDPFMEDIEQAWADAGIFGAWANGNSGPGCNTSGSPGSRTLNYSVGAYDQTNAIASFSSRGPGQDGELKPNISAPGVNVRSSLPGNQYGLESGTSMATPHLAGSVALLWSAAPALIGNIAATRQLLDDTATDTPDAQCGGTDDDNNVYGEGRLSALGLVQATNPAATGTATGAIADGKTGDPVPGATIRLAAGDTQRSARGGSDGTYTANLSAGDYQATVTAFGFETKTVPISVTAGQTTTTNITLTPVQGFDVTGKVLDGPTGRPIPGATVTITGSRFAATTGTDGAFTLTGIPGPKTYTLHIDGGGCSQGDIFRSLDVTGNVTVPAVEVPRKTDKTAGDGPGWGGPYGYSCLLEPTQWIPGDTSIEIPKDSNSSTPVQMPFDFTYFGQQFRTLHVGDGSVAFATDPRDPNGSAIPFGLHIHNPWTFDAQSRLLSATRGAAPNRTFTIEWRDVRPFGDPQSRLSFEVTFHENGDFVYAYKDIDPDNLLERGQQANIGFESTDPVNPTGGLGGQWRFGYSSVQPVLDSTRQIHFSLPPNGFVSGTVLDHNTGKPVPGATINAYDKNGTRVPARKATDNAGQYQVQLFTGQPYQIEVLKPGYQTPPRETVQLTGDRQVFDLKTELHAGGIQVKPGQLTLSPGATTTIQLKNDGDSTLSWRVGARLAETNAPAPGTELSSTSLAQMLPLAVEEVDGSYWTAGIDRSTSASEVIEVTSGGQDTGRKIDMSAVADALGVPSDGLIAGDLAWVESRGWLCMSLLSATRVVCVNPADNTVKANIPTGFGSGAIIDGLAYNPEEDLFYLHAEPPGGGFQTQVRTIAGVQHPDPGEAVNTCTSTTPGIGLAWNPASRSLWTETFNSTHQLDPATCADISSIPVQHSSAETVGNGMGLGPSGDFVTPVFIAPSISVTRSTDRIDQRLPWLSASASSGDLKAKGTQKLTVTIDGTVPDDVTQVLLVLRGNGGAQPEVTIPITLQR